MLRIYNPREKLYAKAHATTSSHVLQNTSHCNIPVCNRMKDINNFSCFVFPVVKLIFQCSVCNYHQLWMGSGYTVNCLIFATSWFVQAALQGHLHSYLPFQRNWGLAQPWGWWHGHLSNWCGMPTSMVPPSSWIEKGRRGWSGRGSVEERR